MSALETLKAEAPTYVPITIVGVKEYLPSARHTKFLLEHDTDDLDENVFKNLFEFLREEILREDVRRRSWGISVKICLRREKEANEKENAKENTRENSTVEKREKREFYAGKSDFNTKTLRESTMVQDEEIRKDGEDNSNE